ncbi:ABC transporter permease [Treponema primitia]|uniref:ABC transporter permease n=1 Tax=Treponema primitia TaxID=88058 RepID=UPI0002554E10|nr:ABC transporter permease [Treponema primitia]
MFNKSLKRLVATKELGIFLVLILLSIVINFINPVFFVFDNIIEVFRNTSYTAIIAFGMTLLIIAKGLDLSVGAVFALCGLITSVLLFRGWSIPVSIFIGLSVGALIGLFNALTVVFLRIPSMIATLGSMYMARGLVLVITKGKPVYPLPEAFSKIGQGKLFHIPLIVYVAFVLAIIWHIVLTRTVFGRKIYAIGGNETTAKYAGINVPVVTAGVYVIAGALSALSGILTAARFGSGQPTVGEGMEMSVIAAVIIGGASMTGGSATVLGTVLGSLLITVIATGMNLVGVSPYWQRFVTGLVIIIAVGLDQYQRRKKKG